MKPSDKLKISLHQALKEGVDNAGLAKMHKDIEEAEASEQAELEKLNGGPAVDPELLALRSRVKVSTYLKAALDGSRLEAGSPEEELRQHVKAPERSIPMDCFERTKADVPAALPGTIGINFAPVVPNVFARTIAARAGIAMPMTGSGQRSVVRLTTNQSASVQPKGGTAESVAGAFTVVSAKPRRVSARLSLQAEDLAEAGVPGFEASLRENLSMVLSDAVDRQILTGDGAGNNVEGLMGQLTAATPPSAVITFPDFVEMMGSQIDGLWASRLGDLRLFANSAVYAKLVSTFQEPKFVSLGTAQTNVSDAATPSIMSAADWSHDKLGDFFCSSRMPAAASNISKCLVMKAGSLIDPAGEASMPAECAVWGHIGITDPYTSSAEATTHVTLHVMIADKVIIKQPAAFAEVRIKTA